MSDSYSRLSNFYSQRVGSSEDAQSFVVEILKCIEIYEFRQEPIYEFLAANQARLVPELLTAIPEVFLVLIRGANRDEQEDIALKISVLGEILLQCFIGDLSLNIECAIIAYEQALKVRTRQRMPVEWARTISNLAVAYRSRLIGEKSENMERAISGYRQALTVLTQRVSPAMWATTMHNLATVYSEHTQGNRVENIEQAINIYKQVLQVTTKNSMPFEWAQTMNNMANAYSDRIRGDRSENIEQAIECCQQALTVRTRSVMPYEWAETKMNLATLLRERLQGDRAKNIQQSINAYRQALIIRTKQVMPLEWAMTMNNLAIAYSVSTRGDRAENIEQAIAAYKDAMTVITQASMPYEWARISSNLANAYRERTEGNLSENIEQAINACQQALTIQTKMTMPHQWATTMSTMARAYSDRNEGNQHENIEQAINAFKESLEVFKPESSPKECRKTASLLALLFAENQRWTEAVKAYELAQRAEEILYQNALSRDTQDIELSESIGMLQELVYAQAKSGDINAAVVTLERGRVRGLSEIFAQDRTDLSNLSKDSPTVYEKYQKAVTALNQLNSSVSSVRRPSPLEAAISPSMEWHERAEAAHQELRDAIANIRQQPGYENFLKQTDLEDIATVVQPSSPIVYLIVSNHGGLILVLERSIEQECIQVHHIWLPNFASSTLREMTIGDGDGYSGWFGAYNNRKVAQSHWFQTIDNVTNQLWQLMMAPLITYLQNKRVNKAVIVPTGYLNYLPLHAAWTQDNSRDNNRLYALDLIQLTYSPNAQSYKLALDHRKRTSAASLLAVNEPRPTSASPLPYSEQEVQIAISHFSDKKRVLRYEQATRGNILEVLTECDVLHFSCHGSASFTKPLNSGLMVADDERLTLQDFLDSSLVGIRLVLLSACETGFAGTNLPDEVVSLPTGLLQAGAAGVAATLWSVSDLSTMILLARFYDLWKTEGIEITQALRRSQQWLRDTTNQQKYDYLKITFQKLVDDQQMSQQTLNELLLEFMGQYIFHNDPQARSFAHPFHWAAFTYVGV